MREETHPWLSRQRLIAEQPLFHGLASSRGALLFLTQPTGGFGPLHGLMTPSSIEIVASAIFTTITMQIRTKHTLDSPIFMFFYFFYSSSSSSLFTIC